MCNSPQRVYILHGIQHHCVWTVGWLGVVACLACIAAAVDKQAQQSSCLVWWCELSRSDRLTSISVFCVRVRPMVAPAVPAPPDTLWYWTHLSGGWVDSVYAAPPDMTRWSCHSFLHIFFVCVHFFCQYMCIMFFCYWRPAMMGYCLHWQPAIVTIDMYMYLVNKLSFSLCLCLCRLWCAHVNWTIAVNVFRLQIFCQRQSSVVGNPIHTSEVDETQTRQFCHVWRGCVN